MQSAGEAGFERSKDQVKLPSDDAPDEGQEPRGDDEAPLQHVPSERQRARPAGGAPRVSWSDVGPESVSSRSTCRSVGSSPRIGIQTKVSICGTS